MKKQCVYYFACKSKKLKKQIYQKYTYVHKKGLQNHVHRPDAHAHIKGKLYTYANKIKIEKTISFMKCIKFKCIKTKYRYGKLD